MSKKEMGPVAALALTLFLGVFFIVVEGGILLVILLVFGSRRDRARYPGYGFFLICMMSVPVIMTGIVLLLGR